MSSQSMNRTTFDRLPFGKPLAVRPLKRTRVYLWIWSFAFAISLAWPSEKPAPLRVVTSVFPLQEFAAEISGNRGEVSLLLPPGAGVHTWQPRASDVLRLSSADVLVYIGSGLEPWIPDLLRSLEAPRPKVLALAESLPLQRHEEGHEGHDHDPHVWLDFGLDLIIADRLAALFSEIDPAAAPFYEERAEILKSRIQALDSSYSRALAHCQNRILLVGGHAAFGYLAKRFGLEQVSIYGLSPDGETTPSRLKAAVERGRRSGVKAVFTEANANSKIAGVVAKELRAKVLSLHTGANLSRKEWESGRTFFDLMEENLANLKKGLSCD